MRTLRVHRTGKHLVVDGFADCDVLRDRKRLELTISHLAKYARMQVLDAQTYEVEEDLSALDADPFKDSGGITAYAVLSTSHMSFHGWPLSGEFRFDLYSCKDFDDKRIVELLLEYVHGEAETTTVWRR